jgi:hypothetical protein
MTEATTGLISHLTEHLGNDEAWRPALDALKRGDATLHLAVLGKPFLGPLLDGIKTIESRFSRVRHAPYEVLRPGDIVAVKQPGGPVVGAFQAGEVRNYRLTPGLINKIRGRFGQQIHAHDQFWDDRLTRATRRSPSSRIPGPCRGSRSPSVTAAAGPC